MKNKRKTHHECLLCASTPIEIVEAIELVDMSLFIMHGRKLDGLVGGPCGLEGGGAPILECLEVGHEARLLCSQAIVLLELLLGVAVLLDGLLDEDVGRWWPTTLCAKHTYVIEPLLP